MAKRKNMIVLDQTIRHVERWRKMPSKEERRRRVYLTVALSIVAVFVLLSIIEGIGSMYATIVRSGGAGEITVEKVFTEKDAVNILVLKSDDSGLSLVNAVMVRFDPARGAAVCIPLSADTLVGVRTLAASYQLGGGAQCAREAEQYFELEQVQHCTMTYASIRDLVNEFGGVVLDVPCNIDYKNDRSERNVIVAAGHRKFKGDEAARLLDCPEWPNGVNQQTLMHANMLCALVNENITPTGASKLSAYYQRANAVMTDSSITMSVFQSSAASLTHLARLNEKGDVCVVYEPQYVIMGGHYELSAFTLKDLSELFH